jgi:hypothetical protein
MRHRFQTKESKSHLEYEEITRKELHKFTQVSLLDQQTNMNFDDLNIETFTGEIVS